MADIKNLLDSIIDGDSSVQGSEKLVALTSKPVDSKLRTVDFDKDTFREKLSMYVLCDIISAMMADDTADYGDMIDKSIMRHINKDYNDTCYGYLCKSRDRLNSPLLGDIIQEIDEAAEKADSDIKKTKMLSDLQDPEETTKEILKDVEDYDELRKLLKDQVSKKVINDVTKVITQSNDAPVFDNIDEKIHKSDDTTQESFILRMCGNIVTEAAMDGVEMSSLEGLKQAIVTYCLGEMDVWSKADVGRNIVRKYLN